MTPQYFSSIASLLPKAGEIPEMDEVHLKIHFISKGMNIPTI